MKDWLIYKSKSFFAFIFWQAQASNAICTPKYIFFMWQWKLSLGSKFNSDSSKIQLWCHCHVRGCAFGRQCSSSLFLFHFIIFLSIYEKFETILLPFKNDDMSCRFLFFSFLFYKMSGRAKRKKLQENKKQRLQSHH